MKLVLDTNVLVSAIFWNGPEWRALEACIAGEHRLTMSPAILDELERVLREKFEVRDSDVTAYVLLLIRFSVFVEPHARLTIVKDDPADDRILETAVAGDAEAIVTGDKHLLKLNEFRGIRVLRASQL